MYQLRFVLSKFIFLRVRALLHEISVCVYNFEKFPIHFEEEQELNDTIDMCFQMFWWVMLWIS